MAFGKLCADCKPGHCCENLTDCSVECPNCDDKGCGHCDGGRFKLTKCPYEEFIDNETRDLIQLANLSRKGKWPNDGGTLDQSNYFVDAAAFWWSEQDRNGAIDEQE